MQRKTIGVRPLLITAVSAGIAGAGFLLGRSSVEPLPATVVTKVEAPRRPAPVSRPMPRRPVELEAARLRAAMHARAGELGACVRPASALPLVPARIEVDRSGQVRDVAFEVKQPMPPAFEKCVRGRLLSWQVDGLELDGSLEVTVTFGLRDAG